MKRRRREISSGLCEKRMLNPPWKTKREKKRKNRLL